MVIINDYNIVFGEKNRTNFVCAASLEPERPVSQIAVVFAAANLSTGI
jgi:phage terminase large subunit-like protein